MADIPRVKGNISKMIAQGAPESDIDAYLAGEGVSLDQLKAPAAQPVGMMEDAAKSVGSGLASATAGTLGMAGDARSLLSAGADALGSQFGIEPDKVQTFKNVMSRAAGLTGAGAVFNNAPTSRQIKDSADPIVSPDYKPKTAFGGYLKTGAEFLPGVALGGPRGFFSKLAANVAAPAIASEAAGQFTEGTAAEPYARVGGALFGGAGAAGLANRFNTMAAQRAAQRAVPSSDDLLKSGGDKFEAVKASDAVIRPDSVQQMAKDIKTEMLNAGKHPVSEGQTGVFAALDRLEAMGAAPGGVTPKDMEVIRKSLVDLKTNMQAGPTARMATDAFMTKYSNLGQADLLNGTNPFPTLKNAIGDWAAGKRSETIQGKRNLAELHSNSPVGALDSGAGGQALQRTMKQLARPINNTNVPVARKLGFNNQEVAAINDAASGTKMTNAAEMLDRLVPANFGAIPAMIARQIGGLTTKRQVSALDSLVRSRSPLAAQIAARLPPQIVEKLDVKTQGLLAAILARPQQ